jgi:hypothetical protein
MPDRTYPDSFRSTLTSVAPSNRALPAAVPLRVRCQCSAISFVVEAAATSEPVRCHCVQCRKFCASSCATYLPLQSAPEALVAPADQGGPRSFESPCDGLSLSLTRLFCGGCESVLGAKAAGAGGSEQVLLALGCVEDASIPPALALAWQSTHRTLCAEQAPAWWKAKPSGFGPTAPPRVLRGSCACGACAFEAASGNEFQTQHCYCNLCRRLSGSLCETWVPVRPDGWRWLAQGSLELVRTTGHGSRHMCKVCATTLTIVYDSQPDCLWPVAGVLDDDSLPPAETLPRALCRAIHICCSMMQPWYELPDDGLPRLKYAG